MELGSLRDDWRFTSGVVSGGHFLSHFYFLTFPPLFPLLQAEFSLTNTQLGLLLSVMATAGLLQAPVGELVDRTGAKRILVVGIALTSAGIALTSLATSYWMLVGLVALSGLGQPTFHPADYALMNAVTDEGTKGKSFSLHMFSGFAGFAAAPLVVGTLSLRYDWRLAVTVVGAAGLVYALFAAVALKPHYLDQIGASVRSGSRGSLRDSVSDLLTPGILTLLAFFTIVIVAEKSIQAFTPILGTDAFDLSTAMGNTALTAYLSAAAGGVLLGGVLADRYSPRRVIAISLTVAAVVLWAGVSGTVLVAGWTFVALFGVVGLFRGMVTPSRDRLVSAFSPAGSTGKSFGFVFTGITLGSMVGPTAIGAVIDATSVTLAFLLIGAVFLTGAGIALSLGTGLVPMPTPRTDVESE